MKGTRNTLTARFGAGLSHRVEERALWGDVAPRVSCQQCETPVHAAVDLADPGPGGPVASGCVGRAPAHPRPDLAHRRRGRRRAGSPGTCLSLGLYSRRQDGLARGRSGGGSLPPQAPPCPVHPRGLTLTLRPLEVLPPVKAQSAKEKLRRTSARTWRPDGGGTS